MADMASDKSRVGLGAAGTSEFSVVGAAILNGQLSNMSGRKFACRTRTPGSLSVQLRTQKARVALQPKAGGMHVEHHVSSMGSGLGPMLHVI